MSLCCDLANSESERTGYHSIKTGVRLVPAQSGM